MNNSNHIALLCACAWIADETRCESVNVFAKVTMHDHTKSTNCFKFRKTNESQIPKENFSGKKSYISASSISNPKFAKMHLDTFFSGRLFFPFCKGFFRLIILICSKVVFTPEQTNRNGAYFNCNKILIRVRIWGQFLRS